MSKSNETNGTLSLVVGGKTIEVREKVTLANMAVAINANHEIELHAVVDGESVIVRSKQWARETFVNLHIA